MFPHPILSCILGTVTFNLGFRNEWDLRERMRMNVVFKILGSKIPVAYDSITFTEKWTKF